MVMFILEDVQSEVRVVRDIDLFIEKEKSFGIDGPTWRRGFELDGCNGVRLE